MTIWVIVSPSNSKQKYTLKVKVQPDETREDSVSPPPAGFCGRWSLSRLVLSLRA